MDFEVVRIYIVNSGIVPKGHFKNDETKTYDAIFLVDKPEEIESDTFLVYRFRHVSGGVVKKYKFELDVCAKNILDGIELKNKITNLLNFKFCSCDIDNFTKFALSDESGFDLDTSTGLYVTTLYYDCNYL